MVHAQGAIVMLIGEFARRTGLSQDTIRFYVRKGLLNPESGTRGGRNPYQIFGERDVSTALMIRFAQSLGLPLRDISNVARELLNNGLSPTREIELIETQIRRLEQKASDLDKMLGYLREKREWMTSGKPGNEPHFSDQEFCLTPLTKRLPPAPR